MAIKFDIVDNRVLVRATDLLVREFRAIWDADKTKLKEDASAHLAFIHLYCDLDCAFSDIDYREKEALVKGNVYGDSDYKHEKKWLDLINAGVTAYMRYNQTSERRLLPVYDRKIDQLRTAIDETPIRIVDGYGPDPSWEPDPEFPEEEAPRVKIESNAKELIAIMADVDKLMVTKEKIEARLLKKPESKNRGEVEESLLESGILGIKPVTNAG